MFDDKCGDCSHKGDKHDIESISSAEEEYIMFLECLEDGCDCPGFEPDEIERCPNCQRRKKIRTNTDIIDDRIHHSENCYWCGHKF